VPVKKYKVLDVVVLGFLTAQSQYDEIFHPEDGVVLESDGQTIWATKDGKRKESITMAYAIDMWLDQGRLEEINPDAPA